MSVFYFLIVVLILWKIKTSPHPTNSLSMDYTNAIKGLFILLVFLSHSSGYIYKSKLDLDLLDRIFILINSKIGQLMVVMFLFYSGYGVMHSIIQKGDSYINSIPRKRVLTTSVNFAIAVSIFIILNLILRKEITVSQALLSLIGWDSVGNSNWYIFCIICCYGFTYIAFKVTRNNHRKALLILSLLCLGYIYVISRYKGRWWYDTILCYWAGASFAVLFNKLTSIFEKRYGYCLLGSIMMFLVFYNIPWNPYALVSNISGIFFALTIVLITMRIQVGNEPLRWLGQNLFPLYIYQRLPMILFATVGTEQLITHSPALYVLLCFACTLGITYVYCRIKGLNYFDRLRSKLVSMD